MNQTQKTNLQKLAKLIRYWILESTTEAGSGHPTSSLSAVELIVALLFTGIFKYDAKNPQNPNNDRFILSKGHAAPLLYATYAAAGMLDPKLLKSLRKFGSLLEGHPTPKLSYVEVATGSLGQGLSIGVGMALNAKYLDRLSYKTFVLLGDSEMAEGSVWEAIQIASHYKLNNLIGIIDVNRLGQSGETMLGYDIHKYSQRIKSFAWQTHIVDGHNLGEIHKSYSLALQAKKPTMIIAKTIKGKGVSFLENKNGFHGKALSQEEFIKAKSELGNINFEVRGKIQPPKNVAKTQKPKSELNVPKFPTYKIGDLVATRKAFGVALAQLGFKNPNIVALDAEVKNSTYSEIFQKHHPDRFFEMFIAEQNMVSTALGLSLRGKIPFVSTFAAFFTRSYDQIRMAQYSKPHIVFVGSHSGVSIGQDGPSQMAVEDIAMFRSIHDSVVLYPCDWVSTQKLVFEAATQKAITYIRLTRQETSVLYKQDDQFPIGGSKVIRKSSADKVTIIAAGITLFEALKAHELLKTEGILTRVIDLYSIKPIDKETLIKASRETRLILTVEDHHPEGGLGEAVVSALAGEKVSIHSLAARNWETSGTPQELLDYEDISASDIVTKIKDLL